MSMRPAFLAFLALGACAQNPRPQPATIDDGIIVFDFSKEHEAAELFKAEAAELPAPAGPVEAFHYAKVADFLAVDQLRGLSRVPTMRTFHQVPGKAGKVRLAIDRSKSENVLAYEGDRYLLDRFQLMSTSSQSGAVYVLDEVEPRSMISGDTAQTRAPDAFESRALSRLRGGASLISERSGDQLRVVGAIRARRSCLLCHQGAELGDSLGAFSYRFKLRGAADALAAR